MSVDNEMKEEYGETECDKAMSEDGDALCVVYEEFEEMRYTCGEGRRMLVWGRGGGEVGRGKWYIGMGVWIGCGASGRGIREGVV